MSDDPPFRRYRDENGKLILARQRSKPFETTLGSGRIDQRKAGAQHAVNYKRVTHGKAGDYELILDPDTGQRVAVDRRVFELTFTLDPSETAGPAD